MSTMVGLVVLTIALAACLWSMRRRSERDGKHRGPSDQRNAAGSEREASVDDDPNRARVDWDGHQPDQREARSNRELAMAEANAKITRASEIVRTTGLGAAIPFLWECMRPVLGSKTNNADRPWQFPEATDITRSGSNVSGGYSQWRWHGQLFRIEFEWSSLFHIERVANFKLAVDSREVLAISCTRSGSNFADADVWRLASVEALIAGPWIAEIIDYTGIVRAARQDELSKIKARAIVNMAARIDLTGN